MPSSSCHLIFLLPLGQRQLSNRWIISICSVFQSTESINPVVFLVSKYSINLGNNLWFTPKMWWNVCNLLCINVLCPAAPRINLPAKLKEPVEVESGEDLVMKVPYSGHPTPKVLFLIKLTFYWFLTLYQISTMAEYATTMIKFPGKVVQREGGIKTKWSCQDGGDT